MNDNKESYKSIRKSKGQKIVFLALFVAVAIAMGFIFRYYVWDFLFAIVLYITMKPVYDYVCTKIKSQMLATAVVMTFFIILVIVPVIFLMLLLADQSFAVYQYVTHRIEPDDIQNFIYKNAHIKKILAYLDINQKDLYVKMIEYLRKSSLDVFSSITTAVGFSINFVANFIFTIVLLGFMFIEGSRLSSIAYGVLPFPRDIDADIFARVKNVVKIVVLGNMMIMLLQGCMVAAVFAYFDIKVWLVAACAAAVFSLIPVIGTSVVWIPAAGYLAISGKNLEAVLLSAWCLVCYLVLENIVKPHIFGKKLNFHPLLFFFLLMGSIRTFNLPGIIIGPVLLTIFFSLWEIYKYLDLYGNGLPDSQENPETEKTSSNNN